jgi:hypothetical protein
MINDAFVEGVSFLNTVHLEILNPPYRARKLKQLLGRIHRMYGMCGITQPIDRTAMYRYYVMQPPRPSKQTMLSGGQGAEAEEEEGASGVEGGPRIRVQEVNGQQVRTLTGTAPPSIPASSQPRAGRRRPTYPDEEEEDETALHMGVRPYAERPIRLRRPASTPQEEKDEEDTQDEEAAGEEEEEEEETGAQPTWLPTSTFIRNIMAHQEDKMGEEAFLAQLFRPSGRITSMYKIIVMAMQQYAVNCSMTKLLHPHMGGTCYVPGVSAPRGSVDEEEAAAEEEEGFEEDPGETSSENLHQQYAKRGKELGVDMQHLNLNLDLDSGEG